jgi:cysteinyl-tRNA synthetase
VIKTLRRLGLHLTTKKVYFEMPSGYSKAHRSHLAYGHADGKALVKLLDPAVLLRAREEKAAIAAEKAARKAAQAKAEKEKRLAKLEKGKLAPNEMFKPPNVAEGAYGSWNDDGIPLTDGSGVELPKSRVKKNAKEWEFQKKAHADWLAYLKANEQA